MRGSRLSAVIKRIEGLSGDLLAPRLRFVGSTQFWRWRADARIAARSSSATSPLIDLAPTSWRKPTASRKRRHRTFAAYLLDLGVLLGSQHSAGDPARRPVSRYLRRSSTRISTPSYVPLPAAPRARAHRGVLGRELRGDRRGGGSPSDSRSRHWMAFARPSSRRPSRVA